MATLVFMKDPDGKQQSFEFMKQLIGIGIEDEKVRDFVHRIEQAIDILEDVGVPPIGERDFRAQKLDGTPFMLAPIVKELVHHQPLYEARVNYNRDYAFRIIFFYGIEDDEEVIYFTRAVIKDDTGVSSSFKELESKVDNIEFKQACRESEIMYRQFIQNL